MGTIVTYSFLLEGLDKEIICPIICLFFILKPEVLSSALLRAKQNGHISGVKIGRGGLSISHPLFAYDSLLYCKASI